MRKICILLPLVLCAFTQGNEFDEKLEKNNHAIIRNYQTINQCTHVINAHKQALNEAISAIHAHNSALQKSQSLFLDQHKILNTSSAALDKNTQTLQQSILAITDAMNVNTEAAEEVRKIVKIFKHLPWVLIIFAALLLLPSLIMLWAFFNLKKNLKK